MEERVVNGVREVFCEEDKKWYPDTIHDNGETYILDERPDRFQYYPMMAGETREDVMQAVLEAESIDMEEPDYA